MDGDEVREVLLELLDVVDTFCREHDLTYYLYAGTLLGAVRHGGFIPWDDDLDVMMPRSDYERFCAEFVDGRSEYLVTSTNRPSFPYASAKVSRAGTLVVEEVDIDERDRFGVSVDVLPFDVVSDHRVFHRIQVGLAWVVRAILLLKVVQPTANRSRRVRVMLAASRLLLRPLPVRALTNARARVASMWGSRTTGHVGMLVASVPWRVPVSWIVPAQPVSFEGRTFPAPADRDRFLSAVYGDYMQPPPPHARIAPHLATAYRFEPRGQ